MGAFLELGFDPADFRASTLEGSVEHEGETFAYGMQSQRAGLNLSIAFGFEFRWWDALFVNLRLSPGWQIDGNRFEVVSGDERTVEVSRAKVFGLAVGVGVQYPLTEFLDIGAELEVGMRSLTAVYTSTVGDCIERGEATYTEAILRPRIMLGLSGKMTQLQTYVSYDLRARRFGAGIAFVIRPGGDS